MNAPDKTNPAPQTVALVGVGLIGGSIAAAVKQRRLCRRVIGVGRSASRLQRAQQAGLIDEGLTDLTAAAAVADFLIFCTPVDRIADGVLQAAPHCSPGTLLTDVGSVKEPICRKLAGQLPPGVTFIGSHPLAGSEKNGFEHAEARLFEGRLCVVTPEADSSADERARLMAFWESLGMQVVEKSPAEHDRLLAATSHLPHLLAAALALLLNEENRPFAASGFRDTTRIAGSDPVLWTAILEANRQEVSRQLDAFLTVLQNFREALQQRETDRLQNLLQQAKTNRDQLDSD